VAISETEATIFLANQKYYLYHPQKDGFLSWQTNSAQFIMMSQ